MLQGPVWSPTSWGLKLYSHLSRAGLSHQQASGQPPSFRKEPVAEGAALRRRTNGGGGGRGGAGGHRPQAVLGTQPALGSESGARHAEWGLSRPRRSGTSRNPPAGPPPGRVPLPLTLPIEGTLDLPEGDGNGDVGGGHRASLSPSTGPLMGPSLPWGN